MRRVVSSRCEYWQRVALESRPLHSVAMYAGLPHLGEVRDATEPSSSSSSGSAVEEADCGDRGVGV